MDDLTGSFMMMNSCDPSLGFGLRVQVLYAWHKPVEVVPYRLTKKDLEEMMDACQEWPSSKAPDPDWWEFATTEEHFRLLELKACGRWIDGKLVFSRNMSGMIDEFEKEMRDKYLTSIVYSARLEVKEPFIHKPQRDYRNRNHWKNFKK